ncbi:hypothetical protein DPEC_G00327270 [Dallia pectoralis]|uniref:Uncharacterized protein n=1 Tax=Dallia pectoralis TaxID=75939 RepID=A0ACC2F893_DALPE|nr:hypothetical protein DPEC_G00327270 [Dallia pectoralis]
MTPYGDSSQMEPYSCECALLSMGPWSHVEPYVAPFRMLPREPHATSHFLPEVGDGKQGNKLDGPINVIQQADRGLRENGCTGGGSCEEDAVDKLHVIYTA